MLTMTRRSLLILLIVFFSAINTQSILLGVDNNNSSVNLNLSKEETNWIKNHSKIVVGAETNWPPYDFVSNNQATGYANDYLRLLAKKAGLNIQFVHGFSWSDLVKKIEAREIDILPSISETIDRRKFLEFTRPYIKSTTALVVNQSQTDVSSLEDMKGKSLAVISGYIINKTIRKKFPEIKLITVSSPTEALNSVNEGHIDGYIDYLSTINYLRREYLITNLQVVNLDALSFMDQRLSMGIRKDWPLLAKILDKAMAKLSSEEIEDLKQRWFITDKLPANSIQFTPQEIDWIQNHPEILVSAELDWPPYDYVFNNKAMGFSNDYLRLIGKKVGLNLEFVHGYSWDELLEQAKDRKIDIIHSITKTNKREEYLAFTIPYLSISNALAVRKDRTDIRSLKDMKGKKLAIVAGFVEHEIIPKKHPDIKIITVESTAEALNAVSEGHADAHIDLPGVINYYRQENLNTNIRITNFNATPALNSSLRIGVRKDWPLFVEILEKAMKSVTPKEIRDLKRRWALGNTNKLSKFHLSPKEKNWLKDLGTLKISAPLQMAPFYPINMQKIDAGIYSEYMKIFSDKLGLKFKPISVSWDENMALLAKGEIDLVPLINDTKQRRQLLSFTKPLMKISNVIVTKRNAPYYNGLEDLKGLKIAIGRGYNLVKQITQNHPQIELIEFRNTEKALQALNKGEVSAMVINSGIFSYYANKLGLREALGINNTTEYYDLLSTGVRKELAPLIPLLERVIETISKKEHDLIMDKWTNLPVLKQTNWKMVWSITGIGLIVIAIILFWNYRLTREVNRRRQAEARLVESDVRFEAVFSIVSDIVLVWDKNLDCVYANKSALDYLNKRKNEVYGKHIASVVPNEEQFSGVWIERINQAFSDGKTRNFEDRFSLFGQDVFSESSLNALHSDSGDIYAVDLVYKDVTQRKTTEQELKRYSETQRMLLKEVNHRVKNNLAAIISMLHMAEDKIDSPEENKSLKDVENRISSLSTVHSMLSSSMWQPLKLIDLCDKIIRESIDGNSKQKQFNLQITQSDILVDSETAHHLALVLNELAINSQKHGRDDERLSISIKDIKHDEMICFTYSDNGAGYPENILTGDIPKGHIGMEIINGVITGSLNGTIKCFNDEGANTNICFPVKHNNENTKT